MDVLIGKQKIYSEFFTNLAVAWMAGGIITPIVMGIENLNKLLTLILIGISGAFISLKMAVKSVKK